MSSHNHIRAIGKILNRLSSMQLDADPEITFYIVHSKRCDIRAGKFCNCSPAISLVPPGFPKLKAALLKRVKEGQL